MTDNSVHVNIKRVICYVLLAVVLLLLFVFNHRRILLIFLIAQLLCIVPSLIFAAGRVSLPEFTLFMDNMTQRTGEMNRFVTRIVSKSFYPFTRIEVDYEIHHSFVPDKTNRFTDYYLVFNSEISRDYSLSFDYCGVYILKAENIKIFDWLGFFYVNTEGPEAHAVVEPELFFMEVSEEKLSIKNDDDILNDPSKGMDVSEIKELREYREGDRLSSVHWKLSSKSEDLIVKEYERLAGNCMVLACDLSIDELSEINDYYGFLLSFGTALVKADIYFDLVYLNAKIGTVSRETIKDTYELSQAIQGMYYYGRKTSVGTLSEYYYDNYGNMKFFLLSKKSDDAGYSVLYKKGEYAIYAQELNS